MTVRYEAQLHRRDFAADAARLHAGLPVVLDDCIVSDPFGRHVLSFLPFGVALWAATQLAYEGVGRNATLHALVAA